MNHQEPPDRASLLGLDEVTLQALKNAAKERGVTVEEVLSMALKALQEEIKR